MRIITPEFNLIKIGYQGENEAVCVQIGVQNWPELYGAGGTFSLRHQRAGDPDGYPVIVTEEDGTVSWVVSNIDTRDPGYGKATLIYKVNDVIAMSVEYSTLTEASVGENPEPPEPWKPWIDEILEARDEAVEAAEDAHEDANSASQSADDASTEALKAEGYAVGTQDGEAVGPDSPYYQNSAKYYHDDIMGELGPVLTHLTDYNNPHQVTKAQVGLGNADNTSDLDKPISTATQAALDNKISKVAGAVADNLASFTSDGSIKDSNISADWLVPVKAKNGTVIEFNSDAAVPLKSALIKGKTAGLNQLARAINTTNYDVAAGSATIADGVITIAATATVDEPTAYRFKGISGHKYLILATTKSDVVATQVRIRSFVTDPSVFTIPASASYTQNAFIANGVDATDTINFIVSGYTSGTLYIKEFMLIDLTLCGFTSSETADVATLKAAWLNKYGTPLPQYIPYNAGSIVSNNAVYQLTGRNLVAISFTQGTISGQGADMSANNACRTDYFAVKPNTKYVFSVESGRDAFYAFFYSNNNASSYISRYGGLGSNVLAFETPDNCYYVRFTAGKPSPYPSVTPSELTQPMLEIGETAHAFEPYHDGGSITADSLNGFEGTEVFDTQNAAGEKSIKVSLADLGDSTWTYQSAQARFYTSDFSTLAKRPPDNDTPFVGLVGGSYQISPVTGAGDMTVYLSPTGTLFVKNLSKTDADLVAGHAAWLENVDLAYELATPTTDTTTPASLTTQKGYNLLRTVSGDIQSVPAEIEHYNGLAAVVIEAVQ